MKERLGRSPDFGDALIRMFFELKPVGSGYVPPPTRGLVKPLYPQLRGVTSLLRGSNSFRHKLTTELPTDFAVQAFAPDTQTIGTRVR